MSKQTKTLFLVSTVMFSLSWLPGLTADAGSATDSSSNASYDGDCDFDLQLGSQTEGSCRAKLNSNSKVNGTVRVRRVPKAPAQKRLSDGDAPAQPPAAQPTEELEVSIEANAPVEGCSTCSRNAAVTRRMPISEARSVTAKALAEFAQHAEKARSEAAAAEAANRLIEKCVQDAQGKKLEGQGKMECLMNRMARLEPEQQAKFYDENIKSLLMEMVGSDKEATRNEGMKLLKSLVAITGNNPYLKESLTDMVRFAQYSRQVILATRLLEDPRLTAQQRANLTARMDAYLKSTGKYFSERGFELNQRVQDTLIGWEYTGTWQQDLTNYQQQLEQLYKNHNQAVTGGNTTTANGARVNPSVQGAGRTALGQTGTSVYNPTLNNGVVNNRATAQPLARPGTATGVAPRGGGPVFGQKVGGR